MSGQADDFVPLTNPDPPWMTALGEVADALWQAGEKTLCSQVHDARKAATAAVAAARADERDRLTGNLPASEPVTITEWGLWYGEADELGGRWVAHRPAWDTPRRPTVPDPTTCDRCGYGEPRPHDLTDVERTFAEHFLAEIYKGEGDERRSSYPPAPVGVMLREDPHYMLCQTAIRRTRRLLLAFPVLAGQRDNMPDSDPTP